MKFKFLFLLVFGLMLASCGDDDDPEVEDNCDELSEVLIGVWESDENAATTVEFKSGGVVVDDSFFFADNDFDAGATVSKTYSFEGEDVIEFTYSSEFTLVSRTGTVQDFSCTTFRISVNGSLLNFTKK